ncbi:hypothetical protein XA68_18536 [Ophiocordyceps unilateralis]|uniref:Hydrophobin n=1 Tax=Ophiocordyceps unilateralis TaxID=268505 RepID=A0A2A9P317_OPHUN|nr:hypothetical protein XA68_18536 [Ophiocordyceps unilateralis]
MRLAGVVVALAALVSASAAAHGSMLSPHLPASSVAAPTCCPPVVHVSSPTHISVAELNVSASRAPELTGGAIPHQMKASVVGLLGFCIMGLVML